MLISRSLVELVSLWNSGGLSTIDHDVIGFQAIPLLLKCLTKTLATQGPDGAWGSVGPLEETAYAILTLASILSLPLPTTLSRRAADAVEEGRKFLRTYRDAYCEYLWIEKITFGSKHLMDTYILAALNVKPEALCRHGTFSPATISDRDMELEEILSVQGWVAGTVSDAVGKGVRVQT